MKKSKNTSTKNTSTKNTIKLDVPNRLNLSDIIMKFGYNRALLQQAEKCLKTLAFTPDEIKLFGITSGDNNTSWTNNKSISFEISPDVVEKVIKYFEQLLDKEQMTLQLKPLYDKFLELK